MPDELTPGKAIIEGLSGVLQDLKANRSPTMPNGFTPEQRTNVIEWLPEETRKELGWAEDQYGTCRLVPKIYAQVPGRRITGAIERMELEEATFADDMALLAAVEGELHGREFRDDRLQLDRTKSGLWTWYLERGWPIAGYHASRFTAAHDALAQIKGNAHAD